MVQWQPRSPQTGSVTHMASAGHRFRSSHHIKSPTSGLCSPNVRLIAQPAKAALGAIACAASTCTASADLCSKCYHPRHGLAAWAALTESAGAASMHRANVSLRSSMAACDCPVASQASPGSQHLSLITSLAPDPYRNKICTESAGRSVALSVLSGCRLDKSGHTFEFILLLSWTALWLSLTWLLMPTEALQHRAVCWLTWTQPLSSLMWHRPDEIDQQERHVN